MNTTPVMKRLLRSRFISTRREVHVAWRAWFGCLSLGERSVSSITEIGKHGVLCDNVVLFSYSSKRGHKDYRDRIDQFEKAVVHVVKGEGQPELIELDPYVSRILHKRLGDLVRSKPAMRKLMHIDITGFTKFHTLTLAASSVEHLAHLIWEYTIPENYRGFEDRDRESMGFGDTLVVPLVDGAVMGQESRARGIIVPGHEYQRLLVALGEIEPGGGTIIKASTPFRPDFEHVTGFRNRRILSELASFGDWCTQRVDFRDTGLTAKIATAEISKARASRAPFLIYPFGPKPIILSIALTAAILYPEGTWFIYPVPTVSQPEHTEGVDRTYHLRFGSAEA